MPLQKSPRTYLDVGRLDKAAAHMEIVREAYRGADAGSFERFYAAFADDALGYEAEGIPYGGKNVAWKPASRITVGGESITSGAQRAMSITITPLGEP